jgi:hypothetical protein
MPSGSSTYRSFASPQPSSLRRRAQIQNAPNIANINRNSSVNWLIAPMILDSAGISTHNVARYPANTAISGRFPGTYEHVNGSCCQL